nr:hypothetical protein [Tanacetum cinerariifolium]
DYGNHNRPTVALDEALVPSTKRLRIGRSNFRLPSDIQSKESTLQVVYDVLRFCRNIYKVDYIVCANSLWNRNKATTIEQQTMLDESLVPSTQRLRIGRSNFQLPSDIQSKEATLQVVYDVLRNSPLFMAFQVTADVPEIYMQEFWATTKLLSVSRSTQEIVFLIWKLLERCCILAQEFQTNLLLTCQLKRKFWIS